MRNYNYYEAVKADVELTLSNEYGEKMTVAEFNENIRFGL